MIFKFNRFDDKSDYSLIVVDNCAGTYVSVAKRLSKFFSRIGYHSVNQNPFPRLSLDNIGTGYDDIERIDEFWGRLDEFDIIVFPDIYFNDWGKRLREMGKMVWGGCESEVLETNRKVFKQELESVGLPVVETKYIIGLTQLSEYLQSVQDKWIKISYYRGEMETFHHIDYRHTKQWINEMSYIMGPMGEVLEFQVEDSLKAIAEVGYDGYSVNGVNPKGSLFGIEVKDCGYIGKAIQYKELPEPVQFVNDKFEPVLQKYSHTGFYSNEIRYTENGLSYYVDGCLRAGSPPSNTYLEMIDNWDEIIIGGCQGKLVEPKFKSKYGVEIILKSNYCNEGYLNVSYPDEYKDNIKLKGSFKLNGVEYIIPFTHCGFDMVEFGSVVVCGDDLNIIIETALEIASKVEGYKLDYNAAALPEAIETLTNLQETLNFKF